ncbi:MAG: DUF4399 domain-containing protein [Leptolyngbyaceae cyanobacterium]
MKRAMITLGVVLVGLWSWLAMSATAAADSLISEAPADAYAYLIAPMDGATISNPVAVKFGLSGMGVAPAGVDKDNTGHHHLLVDLAELPDLTQSLPATDHIRHFGGGQTETQLDLAPGEHTLQLLLGNYAHVPHDQPVLSEKITITVD